MINMFQELLGFTVAFRAERVKISKHSRVLRISAEARQHQDGFGFQRIRDP